MDKEGQTGRDRGRQRQGQTYRDKYSVRDRQSKTETKR